MRISQVLMYSGQNTKLDPMVLVSRHSLVETSLLRMWSYLDPCLVVFRGLLGATPLFKRVNTKEVLGKMRSETVCMMCTRNMASPLIMFFYSINVNKKLLHDGGGWGGWGG